MNQSDYKELTAKQKLMALAHRFYSGGKWYPATGDYYTTSRNDLELYKIIYADDKVVKTKYCNPASGDNISEWAAKGFLTYGFGPNRVFVPSFVFDSIEPDYNKLYDELKMESERLKALLVAADAVIEEIHDPENYTLGRYVHYQQLKKQNLKIVL